MSLLNKTFINIIREIKSIPRATVIGILLIGIILSAAACSGQDAPAVKATWINPQVTGDSVAIPINEVKNDKIVHFSVAVAPAKTMTFMAYDFDGELYVRADACVPCRSTEFSLREDTLVCDSCRTTFKAGTGAGVSGVSACLAYPKAAVEYEVTNDQLVMKGNDLLVAYQNTMQPNWP